MRKFKVFLILYLSLLPNLVMAADLPEITPQPGQANPYKTRSELLMDATKYTGVNSPEAVAEVWATGLKDRSAALQYTVMTAKLQKEYAEQLDELRSNWVTGVSSPWVQSFSITDVTKTDDLHVKLKLKVEVVATKTPSQYYYAKLWLIREGDFWRIERIWTDDELYTYTLFKTNTIN